MTPFEYTVDYSHKFFIEGAHKKGDLFEKIPQFPHLFDDLDKAKEAAISVLSQYAIIRIMEEKLLLAPIFEKGISA